MATDLTQLANDVFDYFLGLYHQSKEAAPQPAASGVFVAFNAIGTPMTPEMFKLQSGEFDPGLVLQQFTLCANTVPVLNGATIEAPGLVAFDDGYGIMLDSSQPLGAADVEGLGHVKNAAQQSFSNAESNYSINSGQFHAAAPLPPDWPMPSGESAWTSHTFQQSDTVTVTSAQPGTSTPAPQPKVALPSWHWRLAPQALSVAIRSTAGVMAAVPAQPPAQAPAPNPALARMMASRAMMSRAPTPGIRGAAVSPAAMRIGGAPVFRPPIGIVPHPIPAPPPAATPAGPVRVQPVFLRSDIMALRMRELHQQSTPQSVTSNNLTISFEYCLVQAVRSWLAGTFLISKNWYVPHTKAGEIASGTGTGTGWLEVAPVAAIVVRKLLIEANWSKDDIAILQNAVNLGPFNLVGRDIEAVSNQLSCPGMQIIGWVLEPMPRLPPNDDPTPA